MDTIDYRKLASKCGKHISTLAIALDGVVKARDAGQESMVQSSIRRAKDCLAEVQKCVDNYSDPDLSAPLQRMREALDGRKEGEEMPEIEQDLHDFRAVLEAKAHDVDASSKSMTYSGTTLG